MASPEAVPNSDIVFRRGMGSYSYQAVARRSERLRMAEG